MKARWTSASAVAGFAAALCLALSAGRAGAQAPDEAAVLKDLREETQFIGVTVSDLYGKQQTRQIPVMIFRPPGDGPFPLVIMNHGRATAEKRSAQGRQRYEWLSRYLVGKGFAVLLPTRVGYADTYGDFDPEDTGNCQSRRPGPMSAAVADQVVATLAFAKTLPYIDTSRWLVMGQSAGGLTAVSTVSRHPPGLVGAINFSGGSGGDPDNRPRNPCSPQQIEALWKEQARGAKAPMLWLYWENDLYWGPDVPRRWHEAFVAGGGQAEFHQLAAAGQNGHGAVNFDLDHWVPYAEAFLAKLGFDKPGVIARPPASSFAAIDDVDKVPVSAATRENHYRKFLASKLPRAYAVGPRGAAGTASGDWAIGRALGFCQRKGEPCKLYAVDNDVVWTP